MKNPKRSADINTLASQLVSLATGETPEPEETPEKKYAREFARKGGLKGGKARADKLTPEEKSAIAKHAAEARWSDKTSDEKQ